MIQQLTSQEHVAYLICAVRRDHIVEDTLTFIQCVPDFRDFKKPLKVKFDGEEADDAGGVRKEFFLLLLKEILDPKYGMFKEYEETCIELQGSMYGNVDAALSYFVRFKEYATKKEGLNLTQSKTDPCLFFGKSEDGITKLKI